MIFYIVYIRELRQMCLREIQPVVNMFEKCGFTINAQQQSHFKCSKAGHEIHLIFRSESELPMAIQGIRPLYVLIDSLSLIPTIYRDIIDGYFSIGQDNLWLTDIRNNVKYVFSSKKMN